MGKTWFVTFFSLFLSCLADIVPSWKTDFCLNFQDQTKSNLYFTQDEYTLYTDKSLSCCRKDHLFFNTTLDGLSTGERGLIVKMDNQNSTCSTSSQISTGHMSSVYNYTYGDFEINARLQHSPNGSHAPLSSFTCFSAYVSGRVSPGGQHNEIAICWVADNPYEIHFSYWVGMAADNDSAHTTIKYLSFDSSLEYHTYKFAWRQNMILFSVDDEVIKISGTSGNLMPWEPMGMRIILRPNDVPSVYRGDSWMSIRSVCYTKATNPIGTVPPTIKPTRSPTATKSPTKNPTTWPTKLPSVAPSTPSKAPSISAYPTVSFNPTNIPTRAPTTRRPTTMSPTVKSDILTPVTMSISQSLSGISLQSWYEDANHPEIFQSAVASTAEVTSVTSSNVVIESATTVARRLTSNSRTLTPESIELKYKVHAHAELMGHTTAEEAYKHLHTKLHESLASGKFAESLHAIAKEKGNMHLQGITASSVTAEENAPSEVPTSKPVAQEPSYKSPKPSSKPSVPKPTAVKPHAKPHSKPQSKPSGKTGDVKSKTDTFRRIEMHKKSFTTTATDGAVLKSVFTDLISRKRTKNVKYFKE